MDRYELSFRVRSGNLLGMKTCPKCQQDKSIDDFPRKGKGAHFCCKLCQRAYMKTHYQKNKKAYKAKAKKNRKVFESRVKPYLDWLKSIPCADCGRTWPPCAMDFDHVRGNKKFNVSAFSGAGWNQDLIQEEIEKCEVVCACCHRIRTAERSHGLVR